jgi:hypothetical protein
MIFRCNSLGEKGAGVGFRNELSWGIGFVLGSVISQLEFFSSFHPNRHQSHAK